ncbi:MAG: PEP-CTERM sorting domain-containing protein [Kiritimatiellaeota bacterium]|nr:PEP-CTERM sorting domain-containing protein [Kiritimatiellota bacterium]
MALSSFTPESNASYLIIKNDSLVPWTSSGNGLFTLSDPSGPNNGLVLTNGIEFKAVGPLSTTNTFRIIYDFAAQGGVANDVLLTVIPEPTTASLLLMLLLAGGTRRLVRHLRPHGSD